MTHKVLGIGYHPNDHEAVCKTWREYDVIFHFVASTEEAVQRLRQTEYVCVTICSNRVSNEQIDTLRSIGPIPIVVLSPDCSIAQRAEYFQRGALDFIVQEHQLQKGKTITIDAVQYYLNHTSKTTKPLTIITTEDIYFCLESRELEVRHQKINLTAREFDLMTLLITHPRHVLTFELVLEMVWGEEYLDTSRHVLWNYVSRLRRKITIASDMPEYIQSVHSVGYRFEPNPYLYKGLVF